MLSAVRFGVLHSLCMFYETGAIVLVHVFYNDARSFTKTMFLRFLSFFRIIIINYSMHICSYNYTLIHYTTYINIIIIVIIIVVASYYDCPNCFFRTITLLYNNYTSTTTTS